MAGTTGAAVRRMYPGGAGVEHRSFNGVAVVTGPVSSRLATREPDSVIFTATAAYPYVDRDRATAGLRGQLREIAAAAEAGVPDWSTLVVDGPAEVEGLHGRVWFIWTATVEPSLS